MADIYLFRVPADFFESALLYQEYEITIPFTSLGFSPDSIQGYCKDCEMERTFQPLTVPDTPRLFAQGSMFNEGIYSLQDQVYMFEFRCTACHHSSLYYIVHFDSMTQKIFKIGQYPESSPKVDQALKKILDRRFYRYMARGMRCEQFGYGVGAFAYYRRIVEETIDDLLQALIEFIQGDEEKDEYRRSLESVSGSHQASDKIKAVKDLLPDSLRADGMNPLGALYGAISRGIHDLSDEECLENAHDVRVVLEHLAHQIKLQREGESGFKQAMQRLSEKQSRRGSDSST